jgi:ubiquinone/menaquinone biosynthesis C-methylase UbiE
LGDADGQSESAPYALGHSARELERLATQARLIDPITRRSFRDAGIGPGQRVLDVGSGAGDVAFLVAELVGTDGAVVGTDLSLTAVPAARARAAARSLDHVSFHVGDLATMDFDQPFDAVVGRYVVMFAPDPAAMLRRLVRHLRPSGLIAFPPHHGWLRHLTSG